jgi:hypothetical protein
MAHLKACRTILLGNRMYKPGEAIPANNAAMVKAWLLAGSAEWSNELVAKQQEEVPIYTADMDIGILRDAGKKYGLKFKVGMKKPNMANALNDAASEAASAGEDDENDGGSAGESDDESDDEEKDKTSEEAALKADLLARIGALQLRLPDGLTIEQVKDAVEKAEAEVAENGGGQT